MRRALGIPKKSSQAKAAIRGKHCDHETIAHKKRALVRGLSSARRASSHYHGVT